LIRSEFSIYSSFQFALNYKHATVYNLGRFAWSICCYC